MYVYIILYIYILFYTCWAFIKNPTLLLVWHFLQGDVFVLVESECKTSFYPLIIFSLKKTNKQISSAFSRNYLRFATVKLAKPGHLTLVATSFRTLWYPSDFQTTKEGDTELVTLLGRGGGLINHLDSSEKENRTILNFYCFISRGDKIMACI